MKAEESVFSPAPVMSSLTMSRLLAHLSVAGCWSWVADQFSEYAASTFSQKSDFTRHNRGSKHNLISKKYFLFFLFFILKDFFVLPPHRDITLQSESITSAWLGLSIIQSHAAQFPHRPHQFNPLPPTHTFFFFWPFQFAGHTKHYINMFNFNTYKAFEKVWKVSTSWQEVT